MTYPEHEKLHAVVDLSQSIGEFIDWLGENGMVIAEYVEFKGYQDPQLLPRRGSISSLLAQYFDIDEAKLDEEKRTMIQSFGDGLRGPRPPSTPRSRGEE